MYLLPQSFSLEAMQKLILCFVHFLKVLFSEMDTTNQFGPMEVSGIGEKEGLPIEAFAKVQEMFSNVDWLDPTGDAAIQLFQRLTSTENIQLRQGFLSPSKKEAESLELGSISPTNQHSDNLHKNQATFYTPQFM